jgi:protein-S-isoprenylcysteine O-methyltransferase Ste14
METVRDGARVLFPPPLIYLGGLALGILAERLLDRPSLGLQPAIRDLPGGILAVLGQVVSFAGAGTFRRRGTAVLPFKPASCLVTSGIYRWTRNPMYVGMAMTYAGVAIFVNSLAALALLPVVLAIVQTQVIAREEAYLERAFGHDYASYKKQVRRWL